MVPLSLLKRKRERGGWQFYISVSIQIYIQVTVIGPKKNRESRLENQANLILTDSRISLEYSNNILKVIQKFDMGTTVVRFHFLFLVGIHLGNKG